VLIVQTRITDEVVLSPDFIEKLKEVVVVMRPFVHWCVVAQSVILSDLELNFVSLNDMMTIQDSDRDSSEGEEDEDTSYP